MCSCHSVFPSVTDPPRERYLLWDEQKGPDALIELTSASTAEADRVTKRDIYRDILQVREYFLFDPNDEYLDPPLQGFRLVDGDYQPIEPVNGRLPSEALRLQTWKPTATCCGFLESGHGSVAANTTRSTALP